ncbi:MAG TPA: CHRD domain-containing protein [Steroidobacteraceae bacterium]|nr:CHRD domain-containing protein [Steroidobacteraceae bacterium]
MKSKVILALGAGLFVTIGASVLAHDGFGHGNKPFRVFAILQPTSEVPSLSSAASGRFKATIDPQAQTITYEVSYDGLEGDVLQSHIHLGQHSVNGGVSVFLCGNPPTVPPASVPQPPACPPPPATVTGVITPANIIGPNAQGIAPTAGDVNEFDELVESIRDGVTYANVHSSKFQGGEIRGQIVDFPKNRD